MSFRLSRQPRLGQAVVCEELACCDGALPGAAARDRRRPPRAGELLSWRRLVRMAPTSSFQCAASPPATPPDACVKLSKRWSLLLVEKRRKMVTMESALSMAPPSHRRTCAPASPTTRARPGSRSPPPPALPSSRPHLYPTFERARGRRGGWAPHVRRKGRVSGVTDTVSVTVDAYYSTY